MVEVWLHRLEFALRCNRAHRRVRPCQLPRRLEPDLNDRWRCRRRVGGRRCGPRHRCRRSLQQPLRSHGPNRWRRCWKACSRAPAGCARSRCRHRAVRSCCDPMTTLVRMYRGRVCGSRRLRRQRSWVARSPALGGFYRWCFRRRADRTGCRPKSRRCRRSEVPQSGFGRR